MPEKTVPAVAGIQERGKREVTRARDRYARPPVDIYETGDGLVLLADLPGVGKNDLEISVDDSVLTIQAKAGYTPAGKNPIYREFEVSGFFRQFELGEELDRRKIGAELKHGVLTLTLPKVPEAKPRQVEVKVS
jgi:HSP20 family molecular chaperone IbpA